VTEESSANIPRTSFYFLDHIWVLTAAIRNHSVPSKVETKTSKLGGRHLLEVSRDEQATGS
jgi:hypothetical protein